jgi:hypothetical protein
LRPEKERHAQRALAREHARRTQDVKDRRRRKKNGRPMWAAKFREETPRKGGGFAIEDRDTALQQYAEKRFCMQGKKQTLRRIFPPKS